LIPFNKCKSDIPLITFSLKEGGETYNAIIDSGSELTLFDGSLIRSNENCFSRIPSGDEYNVVGLSDNKKIHVSELSTKLLLISNDNTKETIMVTGIETDLSDLSRAFADAHGKDYKPVVIIGSNELRRLGARIDYVKNVIQFE